MDLDFDDLDLAEADAAPGIPGADDVYVINLERRADRLVEFYERWPFKRACVTVHTATDGSELDPEVGPLRALWTRWVEWQDERKQPAWGPSHGEAGCACSHIAVWRRVAAHTGERLAVVFEDDVHFADGFAESWTAAAAAAGDALKAHADLVYLGGHFAPRFRPSGATPHPDVPGFFRHRPSARTLHAYALTPRGARALLAKVEAGGGCFEVDRYVAASSARSACRGHRPTSQCVAACAPRSAHSCNSQHAVP